MTSPSLLLRPGARYACFGDGLCCTDAHVVGPLSSRDAARVRAFRPGVITRHRALDILIVRDANHACSLFADGCTMHRALGEPEKPRTCRAFPFGAVRTPDGLRITTQHRCPCRTLGDRPLIDDAVARRSLADKAGRVAVDLDVQRPRLLRDKRVSFATYCTVEAPLLARLCDGEAPENVLARDPLPRLGDVTWADVGHHLRGYFEGSACGVALTWMGHALLALTGHPVRQMRDRPWAASFDRAERRATRERAVDDVLADFCADYLWGLSWTEWASFEAARLDLSTRVAAARWLIAGLVEEGIRPDRAAAEAVMICELAGASPLWPSVLRAIDKGSRGR